MKNSQRVLLALLFAIVIGGIRNYTANAQTPEAGVPLLTTGVYVGSCGGNIGVSQSLPVPLFGLGNTEDPLCSSVLEVDPLPVSFKGFLANLAVASQEPSSTVPTTVTLYVNGTATQLSCAVSQSTPNCRDGVHRVSVQPTDTFAVLATCVPPAIGNCATALQATVDRKQPLGR